MYGTLSQGDKVIGNSITNSTARSSDIGDIMNNYITKDATEIVGTDKVIPIARNDDNSVKVTFDNIYENNNLAEVSKDFYYFRDQKQFKDNKEAIDYYINDRTWKQANVVSIGKEYTYITGKNVKKDQLQRYAYLTKTWDDLPNMFQEGGGSVGQRTLRFGKNLFYAIADPINILGVGVGGQIAKQSVKTASKKALDVAIEKAIKGKTKDVAEKIKKDMFNKSVGKLLLGEEAVGIAEKEGFKAGIKGIAGTATIDSLALGGADVARQYTEMEVNPEQKFDPVRTGTVAIATLGLSGTAQFVLAGAGTLFKQGFISKSKFSDVYKGEEVGVKSGTNKITKTKKGDPLKPKEGPTGAAGQSKLQNTLSFLRTNMFDAYDPLITLQRQMTGVGGSVKDVRRAFEAGMKTSPMLLPYFQFRMTAGSNARASGFLEYGVYQPPSKTSKAASFTKDNSEGLITIVKKLESDDEVAAFFDYIASIRMRKILDDGQTRELKILQNRLAKAKLKPRKNATQIKIVNTLLAKVNKGELKTQVPFTVDRINKSIDFGKLTPAQFYVKYKTDFPNITKEQYIKSKDSRKQDFSVPQKELKQFTDSLLSYSNRSEMIGDADVTNILKANPETWINFTRTKPAKSLWQRLIRSGPTDVDKAKITVSKSPIKDLSKENLEGELDFLKNLISYTHRTVTAADLNRAKVSLYDMLEAAHNSKLHGSVVVDLPALAKGSSDGIVRKVSSADRINLCHMTDDFFNVTNQNLGDLNNKLFCTFTTLENLDNALDEQGLKIVNKKDYSIAFKKNADGSSTKEAKKMIGIIEDRFKNDQTDILTFSNQIRRTDNGNYIDIVYRKDSNGIVKPEMYEILDPNLHQMYKSFDIKAASHLSRASVMLAPLSIAGELVGTITRPTARYLGKFITYTPTFQLKNLIRDTQAAAITSAFSITTKDGVGFLPVGTTGKGLWESLRQTEAYRVSYINGLGFATRTETEGQLDSSINKLIKDNKLNQFYSSQMKKLFGVGGKRGYIRRGADAYVDFVSKIEYASRLGEFQLAKKAGFDDLGASFTGREVTTDFGMRGSSAILNSMSRNVMFLNASMQGLYRGGRVVVEGTAKDRAKAGSVLLALVAAPEVYSYYLNRDNKEYQALPDNIKQLNYLFPMGFEKLDERGNPIGRDFFAIAKPYDFGIFGNITHALIKGIDENSTSVSAKYLAQSISLLIPFNFIGPVPMVNTFMEPILELILNQDAFTNNSIRKYYDQVKINDLRIKGGTKQISVQVANLSKFLAASVIPGSDDKVINGLDPITIDFLINAYAVGILSYGVDLIELGANTIDGEKFGERPRPRSDTVNLFQKNLRGPLSVFNNVFTVKVPLKSTKYYQIYNELKKEAKAKSVTNFTNLNLEDGARILIEIESNARKRIDQGKSAFPKEMLLWDRVNANYLKVADKKLKEINQYINNVPFLPLASEAAANNMSEADYKRKEIDDALANRNELLEIAVNGLADMDIDYLFENILNGKTYVSPNQRDKQTNFLKKVLRLNE